MTAVPSLAPSAQADVDWLGPPQSGLNAYTGELLLETARQRLGSESEEFHRASLALRQFFDLIDRRAAPAGASASLAPVRLASSRRLVSWARAGAAHSASAASSSPSPLSDAVGTATAEASSPFRGLALTSQAAAASPIVTRKELLRHALQHLGGAHLDGTEYHGFIAYRHDTSLTVGYVQQMI